jgi:hypothetical protein
VIFFLGIYFYVEKASVTTSSSERLNREENYPSTSSSREPDKVQAPKKISLSKIKDKTGNIKEHALD